jgi:ABC-type transport system substrate-binding protein
LDFEADPEKRKQLYFRLHALLYQELPYTFLFSMKLSLIWWNWLDNIFIPSQQTDLIPDACVKEPVILYSWRK